LTQHTPAYSTWLVRVSALLAVLACAACGGGGGASGKAPVVTSNPVDQVVVVGHTATFTLKAEGSPALTYQWERGDGASWTAVPGATDASHAFTAQVPDDGTRFRARVSNSEGSATSAVATLTVNYEPTFSTQPQSRTVTTGDSVTLTAVASGNPAPTLQWERSRDGVTWSDLPGETERNPPPEGPSCRSGPVQSRVPSGPRRRCE